MPCSSQEKLCWHNLIKTGIWVMVLPIFFVGCESTTDRSPRREYIQSVPRPAPVAARNIANNSQLHVNPCTSLEPSRDGRRAFFGFEIEDSTMLVSGYFYCGAVSPAKNAGIKIGDKITKIKGCPVYSATDAINQISQSAPGDIVFVEVVKVGTSNPTPIGISTMSHLPIASNRPGRDPYSNKCTLTRR